MRHYDRAGQPITEQQWIELRASETYCRVALNSLPQGHTVSTVWIGLVAEQYANEPLIFETMVFGEAEVDSVRSATLRDALSAHRTMLEKWQGTWEPKMSTCRFQSGRPPGTVKHGKIVAKGRSIIGEDFDICDLHLAAYQKSERNFHVRLNYERDISSDKAVARRQQYAVGLSEFNRSELLESRKDLL